MITKILTKIRSAVARFQRSLIAIRKKRNIRWTKNKKNNILDIVKSSTKKQFLITLVGALLVAFTFYYSFDFVFSFVSLRFEKYPDNSVIEDFNWDANERMNLAFVVMDDKGDGYKFVDRVVVLYFNSPEDELGIFSINTSFVTELPSGQDSSISLSYIEGNQRDKGLEYTVDSIESLTGININKYIVLDTNQIAKLLDTLPIDSLEIISDVVDKDFPTLREGGRVNGEELLNYLASESDGGNQQMIRLNRFFIGNYDNFGSLDTLILNKDYISSFSDNIYTNLSKTDMVKIFWFFRSKSEDRILTGYTNEAAAIKQGIYGDQWRPIRDIIDQDVQKVFRNRDLSNEKAKIVVLNSTDTAGLASDTGRQIENIGGVVSFKGNSPQNYEENLLFIEIPENYPETIKAIEGIFDGNIRVVPEEYPGRELGDLVVVLGE